MKKIAIFCAACLIMLLLAHGAWSDYERRREAKEALSEGSANRPPRFEVGVPADGAKISETSDRAVVTVAADGRVKLNDEEAGTTADTGPLRAKLQQLFRERGEGRGGAVLVLASPEVKYADVSKVVEAARAAGADAVSLQPQDIK